MLSLSEALICNSVTEWKCSLVQVSLSLSLVVISGVWTMLRTTVAVETECSLCLLSNAMQCFCRCAESLPIRSVNNSLCEFFFFFSATLAYGQNIFFPLTYALSGCTVYSVHKLLLEPNREKKTRGIFCLRSKCHVFYRCNSRVYIILRSPFFSTALGRPSHKPIWHLIHMGPFHADPFHFMAHLEWCRLNVRSLYWNKFGVSHRTNQAQRKYMSYISVDLWFFFFFSYLYLTVDGLVVFTNDVPCSFVQMFHVFP